MREGELEEGTGAGAEEGKQVNLEQGWGSCVWLSHPLPPPPSSCQLPSLQHAQPCQQLHHDQRRQR